MQGFEITLLYVLFASALPTAYMALRNHLWYPDGLLKVALFSLKWSTIRISLFKTESRVYTDRYRRAPMNFLQLGPHPQFLVLNSNPQLQRRSTRDQEYLLCWLELESSSEWNSWHDVGVNASSVLVFSTNLTPLPCICCSLLSAFRWSSSVLLRRISCYKWPRHRATKTSVSPSLLYTIALSVDSSCNVYDRAREIQNEDHSSFESIVRRRDHCVRRIQLACRLSAWHPAVAEWRWSMPVSLIVA